MELTIQIGRNHLPFFLLWKETFATMPYSGIYPSRPWWSSDARDQRYHSWMQFVLLYLRRKPYGSQSCPYDLNFVITTGISTRTTKRISGTLPGSIHKLLDLSSLRCEFWYSYNGFHQGMPSRLMQGMPLVPLRAPCQLSCLLRNASKVKRLSYGYSGIPTTIVTSQLSGMKVPDQ